MRNHELRLVQIASVDLIKKQVVVVPEPGNQHNLEGLVASEMATLATNGRGGCESTAFAFMKLNDFIRSLSTSGRRSQLVAEEVRSEADKLVEEIELVWGDHFAPRSY